jgi:hypothetical protein
LLKYPVGYPFGRNARCIHTARPGQTHGSIAATGVACIRDRSGPDLRPLNSTNSRERIWGTVIRSCGTESWQAIPACRRNGRVVEPVVGPGVSGRGPRCGIRSPVHRR